MDPSVDVNEDGVSNPLMHLLSLDLKPSIKKSKAEDSFEESMKIKRVRFSDEVNQFSFVLDEKDSNSLLNHVETGDDNNNTVMTIDFASLSGQNESGTFLQETEFKNCISSSHDVESTLDSGKSNESYFNLLNTDAEDSTNVDPISEDLVSGNSEAIYVLEDSVEPECKKVSVETKIEAYDLNDVINQMESLSVENTQSEKNDSLLPVNTIEQQSDILSILLGNPVSEEQSNDTDFSVSSLKKRSSSDNEKQSYKLNSALTKKSFSSASELSSVVFKAWCEVKDNAKDIKTTSLNEIKTSDTRATSDNAYSVWKKSKVKAFKKERRAKQSAISKNTHEDSNESKTEVEMAFKAWKEKKDELLKRQKIDIQNKKQELNMESFMDDREKKLEADAAFSTWKEHKSHITKMSKKRRAWITQKQKEEESKKIRRDKEALHMYDMWLENKNSPVKRKASDLVINKPPWSPPGKSSGLNQEKCVQRLQLAFGDESPCHAVFRRLKEFCCGHNSLQDEHTGRPLLAVILGNVSAI